MRVIFVYPDVSNPKPTYQLGLCCLSAYLKKRGHTCELVHITDETRANFGFDLVSRIAQEPKCVVGIHLHELGLSVAREAAALCMKEDVTVILGGPSATLRPNEAARLPGVHYVVRGEGERPLAEVFDRVERKLPAQGIPGLYKVGFDGKLELAPPPELLTAEEIPFPDRTLFAREVQYSIFHGVGRRAMGIMTARGCPFGCTYCVNTHQKRMYKEAGIPTAQFVRYHPTKSLVRHLREIRDDYGADSFLFFDDTFTLNCKRLKEFLTAYRKEVGLPFTVNARPETCSPEMMRILAKHGCRVVLIGIESGSERVRREVLNRKYTDQQVITAFELARGEGLMTYAYAMVGLPTETWSDMLETIKLIARVRSTWMQVSIFYPFRGTDLGELCYREGWVKEIAGETESYFEQPIVSYPQITSTQIRAAYLLFKTLVEVRRGRYGHAVAQAGRLLLRRAGIEGWVHARLSPWFTKY